jgi:hypothetical protein
VNERQSADFSSRPAVAAARGDLIEQRQKPYDEPIDVARARKFDERLEVGINSRIATGQAGHTPELA